MDFGRIELEFRVLSKPVKPETWHGRDTSQLAGSTTYELTNWFRKMELPTEDLDYYRETLKPNLPWADDHFLGERVSGDPLNPGTTWRHWINEQAASTLLDDKGQFDHSYAERYWPKYAGKTQGGELETDYPDFPPHRGIRFEYGDLDDLVEHLAHEPLNRQSYLPVWFPEDLKAAKIHKRVPCSLGYHFLCREKKLSVSYFLRSCDYVRHFRDDIYLTVRLLLWVLDQCRLINPEYWDDVTPGELSVFIGSFHMFEGDYKAIF